MSLFVSSLNSGSNGNCYYIGNQDEAILIDGGISCRETVKRMKRLGLSVKNVKAIFVTHEHGDHVHGVPTLSKKYKIPVYITQDTLNNGRVEIQQQLVVPFRANEPVVIGNLTITGFPKLHDASDPHSFIVSGGSVNVGVFTDIGSACENVKNHFGRCHAAFLEANYDEELLEKGSYPYHLKVRIKGGKGHLSNTQAMELFTNHRPPYMSHLFLSHLSHDNNRPKIVQDLFRTIAGTTEIIIASRHKETRVYHIRTNARPSLKNFRSHTFSHQVQLSLFR